MKEKSGVRTLLNVPCKSKKSIREKGSFVGRLTIFRGAVFWSNFRKFFQVSLSSGSKVQDFFKSLLLIDEPIFYDKDLVAFYQEHNGETIIPDPRFKGKC